MKLLIILSVVGVNALFFLYTVFSYPPHGTVRPQVGLFAYCAVPPWFFPFRPVSFSVPSRTPYATAVLTGTCPTRGNYVVLPHPGAYPRNMTSLYMDLTVICFSMNTANLICTHGKSMSTINLVCKALEGRRRKPPAFSVIPTAAGTGWGGLRPPPPGPASAAPRFPPCLRRAGHCRPAAR